MPSRPDRARMIKMRSLARRHAKEYVRVHAAMSEFLDVPTLNAAATQLDLVEGDQIFATAEYELAAILDFASLDFFASSVLTDQRSEPHLATKAVGISPTFSSIWKPALRSSDLSSWELRASL